MDCCLQGSREQLGRTSPGRSRCRAVEKDREKAAPKSRKAVSNVSLAQTLIGQAAVLLIGGAACGRPSGRTFQFVFPGTICGSNTKRFGFCGSMVALTQCVFL